MHGHSTKKDVDYIEHRTTTCSIVFSIITINGNRMQRDAMTRMKYQQKWQQSRNSIGRTCTGESEIYYDGHTESRHKSGMTTPSVYVQPTPEKRLSSRSFAFGDNIIGKAESNYSDYLHVVLPPRQSYGQDSTIHSQWNHVWLLSVRWRACTVLSRCTGVCSKDEASSNERER